MTAPQCTVKDGSGSPQTVTSAYATATTGNTITIQLADLTGVSVWAITCIGADETTDPVAITAALSINSGTKTATYTAGAAGKSYVFKSIVNGGVDVNGDVQTSYTTTFKIAVPTSSGLIVGATGETLEHNTTYGWLSVVNTLIRNLDTSLLRMRLATAVSATMPTSSTNDTTIYTAPASPSGNRRVLLSGVLVRHDLALTGSGNVVVRVGITTGGQELIVDQTMVTGTAVGVVYGLTLAQLGSSFPAADGYALLLNASQAVTMRMTASGTVTVAGTVSAVAIGVPLSG